MGRTSWPSLCGQAKASYIYHSKSIECSSLPPFIVAGYSGSFSNMDKIVANRNTKYGNRSDGKPFVKPENTVPFRVYIGKKGYMENGTMFGGRSQPAPSCN